MTVTAGQRPEWLRAVTELADDRARRRFFTRYRELRAAAVVEKLCSESARLQRVNLARAATLAVTARWLAEDLDDDLSRARSARAAANGQHFAGNSERAQELYRRALELFLGLGEELEAAVTRSSALLNLAYLGEYDLVYRWEQAAREVFESLGDRPRLAILEHNLGNVLYRQDRWEEALERYEVAYRELALLDRPRDVAICLRNVAVCHISLHNFAQALDGYEQTRAYCREQGFHRLALEVEYNIAYLYYVRGEYTRSIRRFQAARRQCEAEGDEYHKALCDLDQAEIYLELNMVSEAARLAVSAHESFARLQLPYETAKGLTNRAIALSRLGRGSQALGILAAAREIFVREKNQLWPPLIDFYRAVVLYREHRSGEAIDLAANAREAFLRSDLAHRAATCELLLAELKLDLGKVDGARDACRAALTRLAEMDLPALEHHAYLVFGQVEEAMGNLPAALEAYRRSHDRLEKLRSQVQGEDLKIAFLKDKHVVYENLVWLTLRESRSDTRDRTTFDYIETAKSRVLADLLAFRAHALPSRSVATTGLAAGVRALREELNWLYRQIDREELRGGERSSAEIRGLRSGIRRKEEDLLRSLRELQVTDRELGSLQAGAVADLETVRSSLPAGAVLLEYYIARGSILVAVVDRDTLEIRELTTAARVRATHRLLQFQLSRSAPGMPAGVGAEALVEKATRAHLRELYEALIAPVRHYLEGTHLIVVPHGFLHYVPFQALHDGTEYLVDRFSISYSPSAGVWHLCSVKRASCEDRSLVLGVADQRAPYILEEARAVAESLPGSRLLLGQAASEDALRRYGARSRFVHIATHGLFRRDNPMFSAIQLGGSRLSLFDLYDLRLGAELVVLSGCGTGLNAVLGAEELVGLTRGLLYAGAQSALVTLWDVHDASTAVFMRRFYQHLAQGGERAESLRRAMRDMREQYPQPYHWAPFVLVGKPSGRRRNY